MHGLDVLNLRLPRKASVRVLLRFYYYSYYYDDDDDDYHYYFYYYLPLSSYLFAGALDQS
eukprot:2864813-Rhodomonas_salina.2